jgi:prepilin-type N-terminal cleavage/methylation domain-containing protein
MNLPRNTSKTEQAFTLIELLTVIAIIALLAGLLFPAMGMVKEMAKKTQSKNEVVQIVSAIKAYYTEYGKYPIVTGGTPADITFTGSSAGTGTGSSNAVLFDVLRNNVKSPVNGATVTSLNPRQIVYVEAPAAKDQSNPKSGIQTTSGIWYDPWGSPYNVAIDGNYNGVVAAPAYTDLSANYTTSTDGTDTGVATGVIVWSFGKNGLLGGDGAGTPIPTGFTKEGGTANRFSGSGDVISWQ